MSSATDSAGAHEFGDQPVAVSARSIRLANGSGTYNLRDMNQERRTFVVTLATVLGGLRLAAQGTTQPMTVYKDPTCGCCSQWVEQLKKAGITATVNQTADIDAVKTKYGVPARARSCHTALVDRYVIEGHVPVKEIQRLLKERPAGVIGLAVPGMPIGSPGMEVSGVKPQPYNVLAFDKFGATTVYASY